MAALLRLASASPTSRPDLISRVTSTAVHSPLFTGPDATREPERGGARRHVVRSPHVDADTDRTTKPPREPVRAYSRSVALVTLLRTPRRSNRR
jgi:hypothetical protein